MAFIRLQNIRKDAEGHVIGGSASAVASRYVKGEGPNHSKQELLENLGRVLWLSEDGKSGIFDSQDRGTVFYDVTEDEFGDVDPDDPRLPAGCLWRRPRRHVVFGDAYAFLEVLGKTGLADAVRAVFPDTRSFGRGVCHLAHTVLRDGQEIRCDDFVTKSLLSHVFPEVAVPTLRCDTDYFRRMGDDEAKAAFFSTFVAMMRKGHPSFGRGCYVDSTPLPNDIKDNPYNALSRHGTGEAVRQARLVLVLDDETGLPLWYDIAFGNAADSGTIAKISEDVRVTLGIEISSMVLDAAYMTKALIRSFPVGCGKTLVGRVPRIRGFHFGRTWDRVKDLVDNAKYRLRVGGATYFGHRLDDEYFGEGMYTYAYVDRAVAEQTCDRFMDRHPDEWAALSMKDKNRMAVDGGLFALVSNVLADPAAMLVLYHARTAIEEAFKTAKSWLHILPLQKWEADTVKGKILNDIISTVIYMMIREKVNAGGYSMNDLVSKTQGLMGVRGTEGNMVTDTPSRQVKELYRLLGTKVPARVAVNDIRYAVGLGV